MADVLKMVKLSPVFRDYLWGGTALLTDYGKQWDRTPLAESWELSAYPGSESIVASGEDSGLPFCSYVKKHGKEMLGEHAQRFPEFPLLIKLIDAKEPLSVQVHPDDGYARRVEGEYGKTELWVVLSCEPGASLYYGVSHEVSAQELEQRILEETVEEILRRVPVHPGDVFFIQAGTLHAIGAGIVLCEIQQNSNTTYRVYDYGRRGPDGKCRELHIDKALEVSCLSPSPHDVRQPTVTEDGASIRPLGGCSYFTSRWVEVKELGRLTVDRASFVSLLAIRGEGMLTLGNQTMPVKKGESVFIPAQEGNIRIQGDCGFIETRV